MILLTEAARTELPETVTTAAERASISGLALTYHAVV